MQSRSSFKFKFTPTTRVYGTRRVLFLPLFHQRIVSFYFEKEKLRGLEGMFGEAASWSVGAGFPPAPRATSLDSFFFALITNDAGPFFVGRRGFVCFIKYLWVISSEHAGRDRRERERERVPERGSGTNSCDGPENWGSNGNWGILFWTRMKSEMPR